MNRLKIMAHLTKDWLVSFSILSIGIPIFILIVLPIMFVLTFMCILAIPFISKKQIDKFTWTKGKLTHEFFDDMERSNRQKRY